ncbi:hypothetical protein CTA1_6380 [Colletotrichum tanaceti]|uniref:Uncharacterized protein n=1 Tax=Colletotrichum tanaceti TaxID=1306861 RepID=A0A4U6XMA8_9PEZI|nr:hypothetical protein CTA1_6380 [Colletotrichum tanaceti]
MHPVTLNGVTVSAIIQRDQAKYKESEQGIRQAVDGCEDSRSKEHPCTLANVGNLANMLDS